MNYLTHQLLNAEELNFIEKELEQENQGWEDGKKTAGSQNCWQSRLNRKK